MELYCKFSSKYRKNLIVHIPSCLYNKNKSRKGIRAVCAATERKVVVRSGVNGETIKQSEFKFVRFCDYGYTDNIFGKNQTIPNMIAKATVHQKRDLIYGCLCINVLMLY